MEKIESDLHKGSSSENVKQVNAEETREFSIQRCIESLVHACQCKDASCSLPSCQGMKRVVSHINTCKIKITGGCPICKQLVALCCRHARRCQEAKCPVPFCSNIKHRLKQQQLQVQQTEARLYRQRPLGMGRLHQLTTLDSDQLNKMLLSRTKSHL